MKRRQFLILAATSTTAACTRLTGSGGDYLAFGRQGIRDGEFLRPRAVCAVGGQVYVIDVTGRVQVFDEDGVFLRLWNTPAADNGTPTGAAPNRDGNLFIPDTHYSRIIEYSRAGQLIKSWGTYGTGPDQFIYPTGIGQASDGLIFISEYGVGAERVHVFDADRRFVRQWGTHGAEPGMLNRAMALAVTGDDVVLVVDTGNHRVQRFDVNGKLLGVIGAPGDRPGQLKFPHDLAIAPDGTLLIAEYGANRVSRFSSDGKFIATYGSPGRLPGEFNAPRGVAVSDAGLVFVADTDNHRVQRFDPGAA